MTAPLAASTVALSLLSQPKSAASYTGHLLSTLQSRLAQIQQDVLVELRLPENTSAYVVIQAGGVVYAQSRDQVGLPALDHLGQMSIHSTMQVFPLAAASAALALAAADGKPLATGHMTHWSHQERMAQLVAGGFSGVLVSSVVGGVGLWQLIQGRVQATQELAGAKLTLGHLLFAWKPHELPRLITAPVAVSGRVAPDQRGASLSSVAGAPAAAAPARGLPDDVIWALFHATALHHLGSPAERLLALMRGKHGNEHGLQLTDSLGKQIDRLAGKPAGQEFRIQCARPQKAATPLSETSSAIWSSHE